MEGVSIIHYHYMLHCSNSSVYSNIATMVQDAGCDPFPFFIWNKLLYLLSHRLSILQNYCTVRKSWHCPAYLSAMINTCNERDPPKKLPEAISFWPASFPRAWKSFVPTHEPYLLLTSFTFIASLSQLLHRLLKSRLPRVASHSTLAWRARHTLNSDPRAPSDDQRPTILGWNTVKLELGCFLDPTSREWRRGTPKV